MRRRLARDHLVLACRLVVAPELDLRGQERALDAGRRLRGEGGAPGEGGRDEDRGGGGDDRQAEAGGAAHVDPSPSSRASGWTESIPEPMPPAGVCQSGVQPGCFAVRGGANFPAGGGWTGSTGNAGGVPLADQSSPTNDGRSGKSDSASRTPVSTRTARGLRGRRRRLAVAAVRVGRLVAALVVGRRGREVADGAVRVAGVQRRPARRALLHGDADLGEGLAGGGHDHAVADPDRVDRACDGGRGGARGDLGEREARPLRVEEEAVALGGSGVRDARPRRPRRRTRPTAPSARRGSAARGAETRAAPPPRRASTGAGRLVLVAEEDHRDQRAVRARARGASATGRGRRGSGPPRARAARPCGAASPSSGPNETRGRTLPAAPWKKTHSPPVHARIRSRSGPGKSAEYVGHVHADRDRVTAVADERRDRRAVRPRGAQGDDLAVDEPVDAPAVDDLAGGRALAPVDREVDLADAPGDARGLEPLDRQAHELLEPVEEKLRVRLDAVDMLGREQRRPGQQARRGRRRAVGVVPVEEHARRSASAASARRARSTVDLGRRDPERVDAAQDDADRAFLEHERGRLEREAAPVAPVWRRTKPIIGRPGGGSMSTAAAPRRIRRPAA